MAQSQTFKSHTRFDPKYHFILLPLLVANLGVAIYETVHRWPVDRDLHLWSVVMALAFLLLAIVARSSALKAQDRIIRLEERLRLHALLPAAQQGWIEELSVSQLIALRFAPDAELPALVKRTVKEGLDAKAIKSNIVNWRADHTRV